MTAFAQLLLPKDSEATSHILHNYLIPSRLATKGTVIDCKGNYPFPPATLLYTIETDKPFDFNIRVPSWANESSTIHVGKSDSDLSEGSQPFVPNALNETHLRRFHRVPIRSAGDYRILVTLSTEIRVERRENNTISIYHGPLLYAYDIEFEAITRLPRNYKDGTNCREVADILGQGDKNWMEKVRDHDFVPTAKWNVAIDPSQNMTLVVGEHALLPEGKIRELPNPIWSSGAPPVYIEVTAVEIEWR